MSISLNFPSKSLNMPKVLYYPAEYKKLDSIGHVIQYSVYEAESNSMKRTFIRLNTARKKYATLREFKAYVYELMATINLKLQQYSLLTIEGVVIPSSEPKAEPKKEAPKPEVRRPSADDMNVLDRLIDAALEDFVLTDEERSVLLKKSKEIGLGEDEFKIYLNGKIQERMKDKPAEKVEEKKKGFFARLFG